MQLTLREVLEALSSTGESVPDNSIDVNAVVTGYSLDTRTVKPGDLFFAIRGPRFDGHDFVPAAFEKGACGAVVAAEWVDKSAIESSGVVASARKRLLAVPDTVAALQTLAAQVRRWWDGKVVAITGSAGKTTTKEICAKLLAGRRRVCKSEGNLNNLLGVPLTLLRVEASAEIAVLELAMSAREEIRTLARIARPDWGVVTNVNPVHLQFFSSLDEIALAKRELVEELEPGSVAFLNADDPRVAQFRAHTRARAVTYGENRVADIRITNIRMLDLDGSQFDVTVAAGGRFSCRLSLLGRHNVLNAAAAIAAALEMGISPAEVTDRLSFVQPARMRGEVLRFKEGFTVINDTYNSNPRALTEILQAVAPMKGFTRKIVVAGEMLELGSESRAMHAACGKSVAESGMDILIAVQGDAEAFAAGAREAGMKDEQVFFFPTATAAGDKLCAVIAAGDLVLVKGSRGVKMELALDALRQKFSGEAD